MPPSWRTTSRRSAPSPDDDGETSAGKSSQQPSQEISKGEETSGTDNDSDGADNKDGDNDDGRSEGNTGGNGDRRLLQEDNGALGQRRQRRRRVDRQQQEPERCGEVTALLDILQHPDTRRNMQHEAVIPIFSNGNYQQQRSFSVGGAVHTTTTPTSNTTATTTATAKVVADHHGNNRRTFDGSSSPSTASVADGRILLVAERKEAEEEDEDESEGGADGGSSAEEEEEEEAGALPSGFIPNVAFENATSVRFVFSARLDPPSSSLSSSSGTGSGNSNGYGGGNRGGNRGKWNGNRRNDNNNNRNRNMLRLSDELSGEPFSTTGLYVGHHGAVNIVDAFMGRDIEAKPGSSASIRNIPPKDGLFSTRDTAAVVQKGVDGAWDAVDDDADEDERARDESALRVNVGRDGSGSVQSGRRKGREVRHKRRGGNSSNNKAPPATKKPIFGSLETTWAPLTRIRQEHAPMPAPETKCMQVFGGVHNYKTKMCEVYERLSAICVQVMTVAHVCCVLLFCVCCVLCYPFCCHCYVGGLLMQIRYVPVGIVSHAHTVCVLVQHPPCLF